ncbi:hypothetical protein JL720_5392 [Aureococcus anophagefferens]|nr:hypothetical protein JL720_5392 [Aureococcus anophagefferens]
MLSPKGLSMSAVAATEDVLAFAELSTDLFVDFRVASQAEDCILVSLALAHLRAVRAPPRASRRETLARRRSRALDKARDAPSTSLKLAKRNGAPCICATVERLDLSARTDIPVRLMRAADMRFYAPPSLPEPRVALALPRAKTLRAVVDRLRAIGERVKGDARRLRPTFFPALEAPEAFRAPDRGAVVCVHVKSRQLAAGLGGYHVDHESIVCIPHERHALLFYVTLHDGLGHLSFYVPVVDDDDAEDARPPAAAI